MCIWLMQHYTEATVEYIAVLYSELFKCFVPIYMHSEVKFKIRFLCIFEKLEGFD